MILVRVQNIIGNKLEVMYTIRDAIPVYVNTIIFHIDYIVCCRTVKCSKYV